MNDGPVPWWWHLVRSWHLRMADDMALVMKANLLPDQDSHVR